MSGRHRPAYDGGSALADGQWHRLHPATPLLKGGIALLVVLGFFGVYASLLGAVAAFGVTVLVGLAFTTPLYACAATMTNDAGFSIIFRLVVLPMFLFSGAFFPISNLSPALEWLARLTPLWHGVDLARMLTLGHLHAGLVTVHLGYLATLVVLGWWLSVRALGKRLVN